MAGGRVWHGDWDDRKKRMMRMMRMKELAGGMGCQEERTGRRKEE